MQRIRNKITRLLEHKRQTAATLHDQLNHLRNHNRQLEADLETHRNASYR